MLLFGIISAFPFLPVKASEVPALAETSYKASLAGWKCPWGCKTDNSLGNSSEGSGTGTWEQRLCKQVFLEAREMAQSIKSVQIPTLKKDRLDDSSLWP